MYGAIHRRDVVARLPGPEIQTATRRATPIPISVRPPSRSCSVRMFQASEAACFTDSAVASLSTTIEPATRRTTRTISPVTIDEMPTILRIERRRPSASQTAIAHSATGTSQSHSPSTFAMRVRSCAVSS